LVHERCKETMAKKFKMKRNFFVCILCVLLFSFAGCGNTESVDETGAVEENITQEDSSNDTISEDVSEELLEQEVNAAETEEEITTDIYVGQYNDYEVDEPFLQIQKNDDGTYTIQVGVYRLIQLDCVGNLTEDGIEFTTVEFGDSEISGRITVEEDVATVMFDASSAWNKYSTINEYKYHKTSDVPNIYQY